MVKEIRLTKGFAAIVDDDDWLELASYNWFYVNGYAARNSARHTPRTYMHRVIINAPDGVQVDHINHNTLDNRRSNLRLCTHAENARNHKIARNNTSGYIGVAWRYDIEKWMAYIENHGKRITLGYYESASDAAHVRDRKAIELYGAFASLNFPDGPSPL